MIFGRASEVKVYWFSGDKKEILDLPIFQLIQCVVLMFSTSQNIKIQFRNQYQSVDKRLPYQAGYKVLTKPIPKANIVVISKFEQLLQVENDSKDPLLLKKEGNSSNRLIQTQGSDNKQAIKNQKNRSFKDKDPAKELASAKKNCQSNLVGHYLSFFSNPQKSYKIAQAVYDNFPVFHQRKKRNVIDIFYNMVKFLYSNRQKKYINKSFLINCFTSQKLKKHFPALYARIQQFGVITVQQFCIFWRFTVQYYYKNISLQTILTSVKVNSISRPVHIQRLRRIDALLNKEEQIFELFGL